MTKSNITIEKDWEALSLKIINNLTVNDIEKLNRVLNKVCAYGFMHDIKLQKIDFTTQYGLIECSAYTYDGEELGIALPTGTNGIYTTHDVVVQYFNVNRDLTIVNFEYFKSELCRGWLFDDEFELFVELWEE